MNQAPYSLKEAQQICADYTYLVGQPFGTDSDAIIEKVTVTPFDEASKKRFLIFYFLLGNAESALTQEYKGLLFDILVIARSTSDQHDLQQEELATWLATNKGLKLQAVLS